MKGYGQFCPIAKASEVLGERWTHLVIRELMDGSQSFNALRKGLPLMSPSLLSKRLKSLERAGVLARVDDQRTVRYCLTDAGEELKPILVQLGVWGQRWARSDMSREDLDPSLLMWDIHRNMKLDAFTEPRTVLLFEFSDYISKLRRWWLIVKDGEVDVCLRDPGFEVQLIVQTDVKTLTEVWMGNISLHRALDGGRILLSGDAKLAQSIGHWLGCNKFAHVEAARPPPATSGPAPFEQPA